MADASPRLSSLTAEALDWAFASVRSGHADLRTTMRVSVIQALAGVDAADEFGDAGLELVEHLITDVSPGGMTAAAAMVDPGQVCDPNVVRAIREMGVNAAALRILADALGSQASVDLGVPPDDLREIAATMPAGTYGLMVPLSRDIYWSGRALIVREGVVPRSLAGHMIGMRAADVLSHAVLGASGRIMREVEAPPGFETYELETAGEATWAEAVRMIVDQDA